MTRALVGTGGKVWANGARLARVLSMQAKATLTYDDVNITDSFGTEHDYVGYDIEGTLKISKCDDSVAKMINDGIRSGNMPDIQFITNLSNPENDAQETVEIDGVVFTELMLVDFEAKKAGEQEVPFKASGYKYIDMI